MNAFGYEPYQTRSDGGLTPPPMPRADGGTTPTPIRGADGGVGPIGLADGGLR